MWLRFSQNPYSKILLGAAFGLCLVSQTIAQTTAPLTTPASTAYPGMLETFEKLIRIDSDRFKKKSDSLTKAGRYITDTSGFTSLDLDPDFLNSIILHSAPGYLKLASMEKCRLYDTIVTDLLKSSEGKIKNVIVTYLNKSGVRETALMSRKDFLAKVVSTECPETPKMIAQFQIKTLDEVIRTTSFDMPTGEDQCRNIISGWLNNPKTPYMCQLHEYMQEASSGGGDAVDLAQRRAVARVLETKLNPTQRDYLENVCRNLDDEKFFCEDFLNVSFWNKVANGFEKQIYAEDICLKTVKGGSLNQSELKACLARMKKETDLCLYPSGSSNGLTPHMECDAQSLALNYSALRSDYRDCPGQSDQHGVTNMARLILNTTNASIKKHEGPCSSVSAGEVFNFNQRFDNEEKWLMEACYSDKLVEKDLCYKFFFGRYDNLTQSYTDVVANIIKKTRGAEQNLKCEMVPSTEFSPLMLRFKSGCFIVYEAGQCFISHCPHRIMYNDRSIDLVKAKTDFALDYFATNLRDERFTQHYLLTSDLKLKATSLNNLSSIQRFFKKGKKGVMHGVGCAEDLLPSFFKSKAINQCSPLPFIIDGMVKMDDKVVFVTRTAYDSLQAPRLISWSNIYSTTRSYQRYHPLRLWTLYGLD